MNGLRFWDRCINHRGVETQRFVAEYFSDPNRQALLIAGAGFDPRTTTVCNLIATTMGPHLEGLFIREERPNPSRELIKQSTQNIGVMTQTLPNSKVIPINVFASDGAVVGGRNAIQVISKLDFGNVTDIIVDFSALSIGVGFPIVRFLFERAKSIKKPFNLHLIHWKLSSFILSILSIDLLIVPVEFVSG